MGVDVGQVERDTRDRELLARVLALLGLWVWGLREREPLVAGRRDEA